MCRAAKPEPGDKKRAALCLFLGCLYILLTAYFGRTEANTAVTDYPLRARPEYYHFYIQEADAWLKGQAEIDVKPDPRLLAMDNPYDRKAREALGIPYLFDRALYDGNYYSYFGTAPLLLYFPYYFVFGKFPSLLFIAAVFALLSLPGLYFALRGLLRYYGIRLECLVFVNLYLGLLSGSLIPYMLRCADPYFLPVQAAAFGLCWLLGASFSALNEKERAGRAGLHFLSAACGAGVILQSRPQLLLFAGLFLAPFYLRHLKTRFFTLKEIIAQVLCFLLPLSLFFGLTFYYNQLRFSGILDFGTRYQLTVTDVSDYRLRKDFLLPSFLSSFFTPPEAAPEFPFFRISHFKLPLDSYLYRGPIMGLMYIPLNWLCLSAPFAFMYPLRTEGPERKRLPYRLPLFTALAVIFFLSCFEFCMAGSLMRYNCDLSLPLSLTALFSVLPFLKRGKKGMARAVLVFSLLTFVFVTILPRA